MNKALMLLLSCLMLATYSFAWVSTPNPSNCFSNYSIVGENFTIATAGTNATCSMNTAYATGTTTGPSAGTGTGLMAYSASQIVMSCTGLASGSTSCYYNNFPMPSNGNYTIRGDSTGVTYTNLAIYCNSVLVAGNDATPVGGTPSFNMSMNQYNSTTYQFVLINGSSSVNNVYCPIGSQMGFYQTARSTSAQGFYIPFWNVSSLQAYNPTTTNMLFTSGSSYTSYFRGNTLQSDFTTGTSSYANTSNYYQALLYATGQAGQVILNPILTYAPGSFAYANFNNGAGTAYMANNTIQYILDTNTNIWFVCPAYSFTPNVVASIQCLSTGISGSGTGTTNTSNYQYLFGNIATGLYPLSQYVVYSGNYTNITYFVFSTNNSLNYYGMSVAYANITGGGSMVIYQSNVSSSTGGTLIYPVNQIGTYQITTWFNKQGYSTYYPFTQTFYIVNTTGLGLIPNLLNAPSVISGWAFYFIALVVSMCVMGFMSKYTVDGAGVIAVIVLWGFTLLDPAAVLLPTFPFITTTVATLITTIGVFSAIYIRYSAGTGGG